MTTNVYLFDLDDTLISTKVYAEIYQPILDMVKDKLNLTDTQLNDKAVEVGLDKNKFDRWDTGDLCRELNLLEDYYIVLEDHIKVIHGLHDLVIDIFKKLRKDGKKIGVVSNSMRRTIKAHLNKYELTEYVDFIFSRDDCNCKKRDDKYWQTLIEKESLDPKECIMIGDDPVQDIEIPSKFGFQTMLVSSSEDLKKLVE